MFGIIDAASSVEAVDVKAEFVDDWQTMEQERPTETIDTPDYVCRSCDRHLDEVDLRSESQPIVNESVQSAPAMNDMASETVGLAAGGAKDVVNFRENVANGFTPEPEAISDEGLFYDYCFETGERTASDALFAPRYAAAVSTHPLTGDTEQYLSVGLDSTLSVSEFDRPRLDLVAVLDVSGSMSSPFNEYYYDEQGRKKEADTAGETKLAAATQSLCALTQQLHAEDRLGVVLYNHRAHVAKPLRDVGATDMPAIRRHIREIAAGGSTNMEDGFEAAMDMLVDGESSRGVERRVVFMTDMMPNTGETGESGLTELFEAAAADGIHTTFVGMGLDTNAELADALSGIRGANHYFIHSADEFEQRLGDEFDYMVTPLVYDLDLELDADGYEIEAVHGSPSADDASDQLMHVSTLFPSAKADGKARGGVIQFACRKRGQMVMSSSLRHGRNGMGVSRQNACPSRCLTSLKRSRTPACGRPCRWLGTLGNFERGLKTSTTVLMAQPVSTTGCSTMSAGNTSANPSRWLSLMSTPVGSLTSVSTSQARWTQ
ncbi:VWA domain-containing protein [Halomicroarcula sp. GCM10025710]